MNTEQLMQEIRETNLSYLMLAQNMIRADRDQAMFRLGVSGEVADLINTLSPGQMMKIASSNMMLCRFRIDDEMVWGLLSGRAKNQNQNAASVHAGILMAGKMEEVLA